MHAPGLQCGQAQSRKSTEVAVEAAQLGTVLDGEGGEMGVGDQVAADAGAPRRWLVIASGTPEAIGAVVQRQSE